MRRPSDHDLEMLLAVARGKPFNRRAEGVKNWIQRICSKYGVRTLPTAVVVALQEEHFPASTFHPHLVLNETELKLLTLAGRNLTRRERAETLGLTLTQHDRLVTSIKHKLSVNTLEHAIYKTYPLGLFQQERLPGKFSPMELKVLVATTQHSTTEEAADELGISGFYLRLFAKRARDRLNAKTTPQAVAIAIRTGILPVTPSQAPPPFLEIDERVILWGLSAGMRRYNIAKTLDCSEGMVESATRRLFRKLGAKSRPGAVLQGFVYGILQ